MVTDAGKILHTAAPDQDHRMFLEVMPYTGNISGYLSSVGKTYPGNFPEG
jgi:hypothetical protein